MRKYYATKQIQTWTKQMECLEYVLVHTGKLQTTLFENGSYSVSKKFIYSSDKMETLDRIV